MVQLHNRSGSSIDLVNWTLRDKAGHIFKFASYTIKPYGYVTIHTGIWNNTGDTAILRNQQGTVIDQCSYQGTSQDYTYC